MKFKSLQFPGGTSGFQDFEGVGLLDDGTAVRVIHHRSSEGFALTVVDLLVNDLRTQVPPPPAPEPTKQYASGVGTPLAADPAKTVNASDVQVIVAGQKTSAPSDIDVQNKDA